MKVRVLIADDEKHGRECLRKQHVDIIAERSDGLKTLETLKHHGVDLAFLAVCLPQLDASEVLKELEGGIGTAVVFVCDNDRFAAKAFDTDVVDYLVKPFDRERFQRAFNCAVRDVRQPRGRENGEVINESLEDHGDLRGDRLTIKSDRAYVVIDPCDVDWISAAKNYSELHMGRKNYSVRGTKNLVTRKMRELAIVPIGQEAQTQQSF